MSLIKQKNFEPKDVLKKPLMAHLSTVENNEPRDSPVWFIWEENSIWIFGTEKDSFVRRLRLNPACAIGAVDFDLEKGILRHVGIRGVSSLDSIDHNRLLRFVSKYLGKNKQKWNEWFVRNIVDPLDVMVQIIPRSIVAKDVSFFKTGPNLANETF